jgi:hypothetical protein
MLASQFFLVIFSIAFFTAMMSITNATTIQQSWHLPQSLSTLTIWPERRSGDGLSAHGQSAHGQSAHGQSAYGLSDQDLLYRGFVFIGAWLSGVERISVERISAERISIDRLAYQSRLESSISRSGGRSCLAAMSC